MTNDQNLEQPAKESDQNIEQPAEEIDVEQKLVEEIREIENQINFSDKSFANVKKLDKYAHMKMSYILALGDIRRTKANDATAQREAQAANWHRIASIAVTVASIVASSMNNHATITYG